MTFAEFALRLCYNKKMYFCYRLRTNLNKFVLDSTQEKKNIYTYCIFVYNLCIKVSELAIFIHAKNEG